MKLLDVTGTNSESFSIGLGEKKVDFRSIDGVFYFRNFGSGWQKASSDLLKEAVKLRTWEIGLTLSAGEIFLHNNSLWYSTVTFEALTFLADSRNFVKIADLLNFNKINITGQSSPTYYITVENSDTIIIDGESILDVNIILPDATTLNLGRKFTFINETNTSVYIFKKNTNENFLINPNESILLVINENSTIKGTWSKINSSGGGGGNNLNVLNLTLNLAEYGGSNPFIIGDIVYYNITNTRWEKAYSSDFDLNILGIITESDLNLITITFSGEIQFANPLVYDSTTISPGTLYYLTGNSQKAGQVTSSIPLNPKKIFISITTTKILLLDFSQNFQKNDNSLNFALNLANYGGTNPFFVNDFIYFNQSNNKWEKAYSSTFEIDIVGFVTYSDTSSIRISFEGPVELNNTISVTPGVYYYLTSDSGSPGTFISTNLKNERKLFLAITNKIIILTPQPNRNRFNDMIYYSLADGGTQILNNTETGLTYRINGYVHNDNNLITFSGLINNGSTLNASIETSSPLVYNHDNSPGLCFIESGNDLVMKNNLGSTKIIVISREKFKS